jgi:hypothetical protein
MLLTIAILGVILNVMIMSVGGIRQASMSAKNHRNAQEISSLAAAASAAGADFIVEGNEEATIQNLILGVKPDIGVFRERIFKLPALAAREIQGAMEYLKLSGGQIIYEHDSQTRSLP